MSAKNFYSTTKKTQASLSHSDQDYLGKLEDQLKELWAQYVYHREKNVTDEVAKRIGSLNTILELS